jgi:hypothetical protein
MRPAATPCTAPRAPAGAWVQQGAVAGQETDALTSTRHKAKLPRRPARRGRLRNALRSAAQWPHLGTALLLPAGEVLVPASGSDRAHLTL